MALICQQILLEDTLKTAKDLKKQVLEQIMEYGRFAIVLAESKDISNTSQLTLYARMFQWWNNYMGNYSFVSHYKKNVAWDEGKTEHTLSSKLIL